MGGFSRFCDIHDINVNVSASIRREPGDRILSCHSLIRCIPHHNFSVLQISTSSHASCYLSSVSHREVRAALDRGFRQGNPASVSNCNALQVKNKESTATWLTPISYYPRQYKSCYRGSLLTVVRSDEYLQVIWRVIH